MSNQKQLQVFADRLIREKHGRSLPAGTFHRHRRDLLDELHRTLHRKLLVRLHHEQAARIERLLQQGTPHPEIQKLVIEKIPDAAVYLTHVLLHFRISYLAKSRRTLSPKSLAKPPHPRKRVHS